MSGRKENFWPITRKIGSYYFRFLLQNKTLGTEIKIIYRALVTEDWNMESSSRYSVISLFAECGPTCCTGRYFALSTIIGSCSSKERRWENIWRHEILCLQKLKLLILFETLTTHLRAGIRFIDLDLFTLRRKFGGVAPRAGFLSNTLWKIHIRNVVSTDWTTFLPVKCFV